MEIEKKIDDIFSRGAGQFIDPDGAFRKKLLLKAKGKYNKDIIIKYGVDPTRPDIHLGHAVCFRKLRQLQELGCKVVFLVGDFTAMIGDPTGKSKTRPNIDLEEVKSNVKTYLEQVGKLVDISSEKSFDWIPNSDWYASITDFPGLNLDEQTKNWKESKLQSRLSWRKGRIELVTLVSFVLNGLKKITFAQLIDRDMFQDRIKEGKELYMHEMLYPVFQGLDSYLIHKIYGSCDLELGGTDQTFNMLVGRHLMQQAEEKVEPQTVVSFRLLEGTDGNEKMSKSLDNYIGITEEPNSMFGKVMSIPDTSIVNYFELATEVPMDEIKLIKSSIKNNSINPRDAKVRLAREIVALYHGDDEAAKAEEYFVNTFSKGEIPEDIPEAKVEEGTRLLDLIVSLGFAESKGDARRKIEQGGVELGGEKITDPNSVLVADHSGKVLKIGKKDFVKIVF